MTFRTSDQRRHSILLRLALVFVVVGALTRFGFNYDETWQHPEIPHIFHVNALANGTDFKFSDLRSGFEFRKMDGAPRARFISNFCLWVNAKVRHHLFHYIPPHPSFSFVWIFTVGLALCFLFGFLKNEFPNSLMAPYIGTCLYVTSLGYLSGLSLLFHPAKPLTNFALVALLWVASKLQVWCPDGIRVQNRTQKLAVIFLWVGVFLSLFIDEMAWHIPVTLLIVFPNLFRTSGNYRPRVFLAFIFVSFFLVITFLVPFLTDWLGIGVYDFWSYAYFGNSTLRNWSFIQILLQLYAQTKTLILSQTGSVMAPGFFAYSALATLAIFLRLKSESGRSEALSRFLRWAVAAMWFLFFHSFIMSRQDGMLTSGFYYGSAFSVYFVVIVVYLIRQVVERWRCVGAILIAMILMSNVRVFGIINLAWRDGHDRHYRSFFRGQNHWMTEGETITFKKVRAAWRVRRIKAKVDEFRPELPPRGMWLLRELSYYHQPSDW